MSLLPNMSLMSPPMPPPLPQQQTTLFKKVFLDQRISLKPDELRAASDNIDLYLTDIIRKKIEGRCCIHGYVKPDSTKMLSRSLGQAEHCRFTGDFLFMCKVQVQCLFPHADMIVVGRILKINKIGAIALIMDNEDVQEAMRIIVPRDLHIGNNEFDTLQEGQSIRIRLLRSRFQAMDLFINTVGMFETVV